MTNFKRLQRAVFFVLTCILVTGCEEVVIGPPKDVTCCCEVKGGFSTWTGKGSCSGNGHSCVGTVWEGENICKQRKDASKTILKSSTTAKPLNLSVPNLDKEILSASLQTSYPGSCKEECKAGSDSPYCLVVPKFSNSPIQTQLSEFGLIFAKNKGSIAKADIMKIFDVKHDPCNRSDTQATEGKVINTGEMCEFKAEFKMGPVKGMGLSITLPAKLEGSVDTKTATEVKFDRLENSPVLKFDGKLEEDFGGPIRAVTFGTDRLFVGTVSGCISFPL